MRSFHWPYAFKFGVSDSICNDQKEEAQIEANTIVRSNDQAALVLEAQDFVCQEPYGTMPQDFWLGTFCIKVK